MKNQDAFVEHIDFDESGLVPVIVQEVDSGDVLMLAYMNESALHETLRTGRMTYWSRSRQSLWKKGETSGHVQHVEDAYLDCDGDALLFEVRQEGGAACHTGHRSCFFRRLENGQLQETEARVFDPENVYGD